MTDLRKAAEMALESMLAVLCDPEGVPCFSGSDGDRKEIENSIAALKEALAQPEQEPVAWMVRVPAGRRCNREETFFYFKDEWPKAHAEYGDEVTPLYTHPASVPKGWQLVNRNMTPEQRQLMLRAEEFTVDEMWIMLLAAAPRPEDV